MKVAVLTSSRADYSIYFPLIKLLKEDSYFELSIIVFGTHLSKMFGNTVDQITKDGFTIYEKIETAPTESTPFDISYAIGDTILKFSSFWKKNYFDLVFCLGDRYEMFAACAASVPFNIRLAHIHGGEKTLGAIDDCFRHSITHMAAFHFTSAEPYYNRVTQLKESDFNVYNVGALSFDNLANLDFLSVEEFKANFNIDLRIKSILITFHPETVSFEKNKYYIEAIIESLNEFKGYQYIITMPNADTMGSIIREKLNIFIENTPNAIGVESFGTIGYLTCMKHCKFMLGNSSSGFIEAAFFNKPVINVGSRQNGRINTPNIINCEIQKDLILAAMNKISINSNSEKIDIYGDGNAACKILSIIKNI